MLSEDGTAFQEWEDLLGTGVRKCNLVEGKGSSPHLGSLVLFNWKGILVGADGSLESTFAERRGVTTRIGDGDEIPGLELVLRYMQAGQQCRVRCESRFAYGPDGCPPIRRDDKAVPPDTDVELTVELVEVLSDTPVSSLTVCEKVAEGKRKKAVGNDHFARAAYGRAMRSYATAQNVVAEVSFQDKDPGLFDEARKLRIDCGNNIATACMRVRDHERAKEAAIGVLEVDPLNTKALFRAGQIASLQSHFDEAKLALRRALELDPASKEIQAELRRLSMRMTAYNAKEKAMHEAMGRSLLRNEGAGVSGSSNEKGIHGVPSITSEDTTPALARSSGGFTLQNSAQEAGFTTSALRWFATSSMFIIIAFAVCSAVYVESFPPWR